VTACLCIFSDGTFASPQSRCRLIDLTLISPCNIVSFVFKVKIPIAFGIDIDTLSREYWFAYWKNHVGSDSRVFT
jgi:hypothetical protein